MRRGRWAAGAALALLAAGACDRGGARPAGGQDAGAPAGTHVDSGAPVGRVLPQGVTREVGEDGRKLYVRACIMCHGEQAGGTQLGPSLTDLEWTGGRSGTFEEITAVVRDGVPEPADFPVPMPPRGDGSFTDAQIRAVAAYTYSISNRR